MSARDELHAELEQWMHSHTADALLDAYAHELAELQRLRMAELDLTGQKARIVGRIVDLIDPEAKP